MNETFLPGGPPHLPQEQSLRSGNQPINITAIDSMVVLIADQFLQCPRCVVRANAAAHKGLPRDF